LIDAIYYVILQEFPFGGHLAKTELENKKKYLKYLHHSVQCNKKLSLGNSTVCNGTSHDIQNNPINSISIIVVNKINEAVKHASFVFIIKDETVDIS
jgi:hypothetical protein